MKNTKKNPKNMRPWMFITDYEKLWEGGAILATHLPDFKIANRVLHRKQNEQNAERLFNSIMAQIGVPVSTVGKHSAVLRGLETDQLVALVKLGKRLGRLAEAAKGRLQRNFNASTIKNPRPNRTIYSTPLRDMSTEQLWKLYNFLLNKNDLTNSSAVRTEIVFRDQEKVA
jgi:hypothetical protein